LSENQFSQEDHDVLIDLKRILLSYIENNTKIAETRDRKLDTLQASFTRFQETLARDMCEDRAKVTNLEKDIIRLQGMDSSLSAAIAAQGTDLVVQKGILQTQLDNLKSRNYEIDKRLSTVEDEVKNTLPLEIDASSDEAKKEAEEKRKEEKAERREELMKWVGLATLVGTLIGWVVGELWH
jgi:hypothetical protein